METAPSWFCEIMRAQNFGDTLSCGSKTYVYRNGVWNASHLDVSDQQKQTEEIFAFKWKKETTFNSPEALGRVRDWLIERYGTFSALLPLLPPEPVVLDAGCGAGMSALEYFKPLSKIRYIGCDISEAIWVAVKRFNLQQERERERERERESSFVKTLRSFLLLTRALTVSFQKEFSIIRTPHAEHSPLLFHYCAEEDIFYSMSIEKKVQSVNLQMIKKKKNFNCCRLLKHGMR